MSPPNDVRSTVSTMWRTRPARRRSDRMVAGVAAAIARRYDIDPVLARIGFVVAAFYGVGILLYLAAWVGLPPDHRDPPGARSRTGAVVQVVVGVLVVVAAVASIGGVLGGDPDFLIGLLVVGGLLYLLEVNRGEHGLAVARAEEEARAPAAAGAAPGSPGAPGQADAVGEPGALAAAAWPETGPPPPVRPRRRTPRIVLVGMGAVLVVTGLTALVLLLTGATFPMNRALLAAVLGTLGVVLLVGAFTGGARRLLWLAVPLVVVGLVVTTVRAPWQGGGERLVVPASVDQVAPQYRHSLGRFELDLRGLDLGAPAAVTPVPPAVPAPGAAPPAAPAQPGGAPAQPGTAPPAAVPPAVPPVVTAEPVRTRVDLGVGEVVVIVPRHADVRVRCHAEFGEVDCLGVPGARSGGDREGWDRGGWDRSGGDREGWGWGWGGDDRGRQDWGGGPTADARVTDLGADGVAGGRPLELDVNVGTGHVEVRRG